jgi:hypothetical protein
MKNQGFYDRSMRVIKPNIGDVLDLKVNNFCTLNL